MGEVFIQKKIKCMKSGKKGGKKNREFATKQLQK